MPLYKCECDDRSYTRIPDYCSCPRILVLSDTRLVAISKYMSKILRHSLKDFCAHSRGGWLPISTLSAMLAESFQWIHSRSEAREIIIGIAYTDPKNRFEIRGNLIRARYGHSSNVSIEYTVDMHSKILYHGTCSANLRNILLKGILKGKRKYVHLSTLLDDACETAKRWRKGTPIVLIVDAEKLRDNGYLIYVATNSIRLVEHVPPHAILKWVECGNKQKQ